MRRSWSAVLLALAPGCTAVTDFDAQCSKDDDCAAIGRSLVCDLGTCALPALVTPDLTTSLSDASLGCHALIGETRDAAGVLTLGTLLPLSGGLAGEGPAMENGVRLAVDEINEAGGIGGRLLRVLACDSGTNPDIAERAAQHLVDVAGVPAIIGPGSSTEVIETFRRVTLEAGTLLISPSATSPAISTLDDDGLVWRTVPSDALQGDVIAGFLADRGHARVFVVNRDDAYGNGLASVVRARFCRTQACAESFRSRAYPADDLSAAQRDAQLAIVGEVEAFAPDAVVLIGYAPDGLTFLNLAAGKGWPFVLSEGLRTDSLVTGIRDPSAPDALLVPGVGDPSLLCDVVGTYPSYPRETAWEAFKDRYAQLTGGEVPGTYSVHAYDATYALALATAAASGAGVRSPRGRDLAEGLARLSRGDAVFPGGSPGAFGDGVRKLGFDALANIDLQGLSGPLDFDRNGEAASSMELWGLDPAATDAGIIVTLGPVWDGVSVDSDGVPTYDFGGIPSSNASPACAGAER